MAAAGIGVHPKGLAQPSKFGQTLGNAGVAHSLQFCGRRLVQSPTQELFLDEIRDCHCVGAGLQIGGC